MTTFRVHPAFRVLAAVLALVAYCMIGLLLFAPAGSRPAWPNLGAGLGLIVIAVVCPYVALTGRSPVWFERPGEGWGWRRR